MGCQNLHHLQVIAGVPLMLAETAAPNESSHIRLVKPNVAAKVPYDSRSNICKGTLIVQRVRRLPTFLLPKVTCTSCASIAGWLGSRTVVACCTSSLAACKTPRSGLCQGLQEWPSPQLAMCLCLCCARPWLWAGTLRMQLCNCSTFLHV